MSGAEVGPDHRSCHVRLIAIGPNGSERRSASAITTMRWRRGTEHLPAPLDAGSRPRGHPWATQSGTHRSAEGAPGEAVGSPSLDVAGKGLLGLGLDRLVVGDVEALRFWPGGRSYLRESVSVEKSTRTAEKSDPARGRVGHAARCLFGCGLDRFGQRPRGREAATRDRRSSRQHGWSMRRFHHRRTSRTHAEPRQKAGSGC
jgi:hypothetical protein